MDDERFERDLRIALRGLAPDRAEDELHQRVAAIPTTVTRRRPAAVAWPGLAGVAMVAAVLVVAITLRPSPASPAASSPPAAVASPTPSPVNLEPAQYANDPRLHACLRTGPALSSLDDALYAFELPRARDYRTHLRIGYLHALATSDQPALVVVARTSNPRLHRSPPMISPTSTPSQVPETVPGYRAVCVGIADRDDPVDVGDVADADLVLPPAEGEVIGPLAARHALLDRRFGEIFAMTWDPVSAALWLVTGDRQLVKVGADGATQGWPLPSGPELQPEPAIQAGLIQPTVPTADYYFRRLDLAVTSDGAVWIAAGHGLVRFDPATETSQLRAFPSDPTILEGETGRWLSAVAADGDDVLVAVNQTADLLRVSPDMADGGTIPLPADALDVAGLTVSDGHIFVGAHASFPNVLVLNRSGSVIGSGSAFLASRSMRVAPGGRTAILPTNNVGEDGQLMSPDGTSQRLVIPVEAVASAEYEFHGNGGVLVATDWTDHTWYAERGGLEILVVDGVPHS
jgi:hypothetical protein